MTEKLLKYYLSDKHIYEFYIPDFEIGKKICSPIRNNDPRPSFQVKYSEKGFLYWRDFGITQDRFDAIEFVSKKFNVSRKKAVYLIWEHIIKNKEVNLTAPKQYKVKFSYDVYKHSLNAYELRYWNQMHIDKKMLIRYDIWGLEGLYRGDKLIWKSTNREPAFIYYF